MLVREYAGGLKMMINVLLLFKLHAYLISIICFYFNFLLEKAACYSCFGSAEDCDPEKSSFKGKQVSCGLKDGDFGKNYFCVVSSRLSFLTFRC